MSADAVVTGAPTGTVDAIGSALRAAGRQRGVVGAFFVLGGVVVAAGLAWGALGTGTLSRSMAFQPWAQQLINHIQVALGVAGGVLLPAAMLSIGGVKLAARRSPLAAQVDSWSSYELTDFGRRELGPGRRALRAAFAGGIPAIAAAGVCLAILTTSIGNEVSAGPDRPIQTALTRLAPGNELVVGYAAAMPMVESDVSAPLADRVLAAASARGVGAHLLRLDLGSIVVGHRPLAALTLGVDVPASSPLHWSAGHGCRALTAEVGTAGGAAVGSTITVNGDPVRVVGAVAGISAINRVGLVMDQRAVAACLQQDPTAPVHAIVLATGAKTAEAILRQADTTGETATVISSRTYLKNSEAFWTSNVKPITNILAMVSGLVALVAMAGAVSGRILRNRREYAAKLAAGISPGVLRATEILRAAKDGVVAGSVGAVLAMVIVPLTNATEPGLQAGVSRNDLLVGFAVGLLGCVGGAVIRTVRVERTVDVAGSTRI